MYQARNKAQVQKMRAWFRQQKDNKSCVDCGVAYPHYVLEYDHLPGKGKEVALARAMTLGWGPERLLSEMAKCDLVCANCHKIRTFNRRGAHGVQE
jgi:hypothetical protein